MARTPPNYRVGSLELVVLSDGYFRLDAGATFGVVPRVIWEPIVGPLDEQHRMSLALNCLLLESQGRRLLIETGLGDKDRARWGGSPIEQGGLLADLAACGLRPDDIDIVINTHLHADHCGWNTRLIDGQLALTFPRARYYVQRGEWEAATHPNERTRATYLAENLTPLADAGQLELVDGERRVTDEVTIVPSPGHTADHASVVISSGGETALYVGDIAQHTVQLERPAWVSSFDVLPLVSLETKKGLMERAARENALVVAVHCPYPGVGRLAQTPEGRRKWVAVE